MDRITRKVWVEDGKIRSSSIEIADYSTKDGGKITRTVTFEMDKAEASRQLKWVKEAKEKAKREYEQAKHNITPTGRANLMQLERGKMKIAREQMEEMEKSEHEYEEAIKLI